MHALRALVVAMTVGGLSSLAEGAAVCFATDPTGSCTGTAAAVGNGGSDVDATASFSVSGGILTVTLTNLLTDARSVGQLISDVFFTLSGTTSGAGLQTASVPLVTVGGDGTTIFSSGTTTWLLSGASNNYHLDVLAGPASGPANLVIGPPGAGGTYSNANGSIAGNRPHNPFIDQSVSFNLALTGLTSDTRISDVAISFGTTPSTFTPSAVPIPAAVWLFASGLIGLIGVARRKLPSLANVRPA